MNAIQSQMLPSIAGATLLMHELSPRGLELNFECLQRVARSLRRSLLPASPYLPCIEH